MTLWTKVTISSDGLSRRSLEARNNSDSARSCWVSDPGVYNVTANAHAGWNEYSSRSGSHGASARLLKVDEGRPIPPRTGSVVPFDPLCRRPRRV